MKKHYLLAGFLIVSLISFSQSLKQAKNTDKTKNIKAVYKETPNGVIYTKEYKVLHKIKNKDEGSINSDNLNKVLITEPKSKNYLKSSTTKK